MLLLVLLPLNDFLLFFILYNYKSNPFVLLTVVQTNIGKWKTTLIYFWYFID